MTRNPRVSISILVQKNPYNRVVIQGRAVPLTNQAAAAHIAKKCIGASRYQRSRPDEKRIIIKIEPIKIT